MAEHGDGAAPRQGVAESEVERRDGQDRLIRDAIGRVENSIERMLLGGYATTTAATKPQGPPLTYDRLLEALRGIPPAPPPLQLLEVPLYAVSVQARRHPRKKRRLQKKWLKRYGTRREYRRHFEPGQVLVDESRGLVYGHREEIEAMRQKLPHARSIFG